jgi:cardiolipin synthase
MADLLPQLLTRHWITLHGLVVFTGLAVYITASHTLHQRRHPSAAIAWMVGLALMPYVSLPLYLMFGNRKVVDPRLLEKKASPPVPQAAGLPPTRQLAAALGLPDATVYTALQVHGDGGQALQALLRVVDGAHHTLDVCTFILGRDALSRALAQRVLARARAGVRVRLLLDGVGYFVGGMPTLRELKRAGVQVALFAPLTSALRGRTNLRNHRKMTLADGQWLWCGGRNLAAEYFDGDLQGFAPAPPHAWGDLSFDLQGGLAMQAQRQFEQDWAFATQAPVPAPASAPVATASSGPALGQLVPSGPDQLDDTFYTLLVSGCYTSRRRVLAITPYFVPDTSLLLALTLAARRGVQVDLLLPRRSNHRLADIARNRALRELWRAGAGIWLAPRMLHAKAIVIDDELALVGSANLDERSLFLNYELMVAFHHTPDIRQFAQWIERQRAGAQAYALHKPGLWRELTEGLVLWLAFQL